jgi:hypothetical protein
VVTRRSPVGRRVRLPARLRQLASDRRVDSAPPPGPAGPAKCRKRAARMPRYGSAPCHRSKGAGTDRLEGSASCPHLHSLHGCRCGGSAPFFPSPFPSRVRRAQSARQGYREAAFAKVWIKPEGIRHRLPGGLRGCAALTTKRTSARGTIPTPRTSYQVSSARRARSPCLVRTAAVLASGGVVQPRGC